MAGAEILINNLGGVVDERGTGRRVLDRWWALYADPELPVVVELNMRTVDGEPECESAKVLSRDDLSGVPAVNIELPFDRIIPAVIDAAVRFAARLDAEAPASDPWGASLQETRRQVVRPTRVTENDEYLESIAKVYREALVHGVHPTVAVQRHFDLSRSTAGRHVLLARRAGKLRPTSSGVAGEEEEEEQT